MRSPIKIAALITLSVALACPALTGAGQGQKPVRIGPAATFSDYSEKNLMDERGFLYGLDGSYTKTYGSSYFSLEGAMLMGFKNYSGAQGSSASSIRDTFFEARALLGTPLYLTMKSRTDIFGGLGFRRVYDELSRVSILNVSGYDRRTTCYYLPIGLKYAHALSGPFSIEAVAEIDALIWGQQLNYNMPNNWPSAENRMGSGHAFRGAINIVKSGFDVDTSLGARVVYWKTYASNVVNAIREPENETTEVTVALTFGF